MKKLELAGKQFGRLKVLAFAGVNKRQNTLWECQCACGATTIAVGRDLTSGQKQSCGCLRLEFPGPVKHGHSGGRRKQSQVYTAWLNMKARCTDPNNRAFSRYGGRGITIDPAWMEFRNFLADMNEPPEGSARMTLERIDNLKGYSKTNCRWASYTDQARNRRNSRFITYRGKTKTIAEWAEEVGLKWDTLARRLDSGMRVGEALNATLIFDLSGLKFGRLTVVNCEGVNRHQKRLWRCKCSCGNYTTVIASQLLSGQTKSCGCWKREGTRPARIIYHDGKSLTVREWARELGISYGTLRARLDRPMPLDRALVPFLHRDHRHVGES